MNGTTYAAGDTATITGVGTLTIGADGAYTFIPALNYNGPVPVATYTVSDGALTDTATLTLDVTPVNDPPVAADDTGTTPEDTPISGNVLTNDTDVDSSPLTVTQFVVNGTTYAAGDTATITGVGTLTIGADGAYTFVPALNYNGPVPVATYTVSDGALTDTATLTLDVTPVNDPPVPNPDRLTIPPQSSVDGRLVFPVDTSESFFDVDGDPLTYSASGLPPGLSINPRTGVIRGTLPNDASQQSPYVVVVTATDPDGLFTRQIFIWTVTNPAPNANDDAGTTPEDTVLTGSVLTNDTDPDGDSLAVTQFVVGGTTYAAGQTATLAGVGTLVIKANGSYTFTPALNYNGPVPTATYTLSDGNGGTDTAVLTITVTPINDRPVAANDTGTTPEETPISGNVLTNDTDVDGSPLTVTQFVVNGTTYTAGDTATITGVGTLTIGADGAYTFIPALNYTGPVPVATYTVSDGAHRHGHADAHRHADQRPASRTTTVRRRRRHAGHRQRVDQRHRCGWRASDGDAPRRPGRPPTARSPSTPTAADSFALNNGNATVQARRRRDADPELQLHDLRRQWRYGDLHADHHHHRHQ